MTDIDIILKNAFIDAFYQESRVENQSFSPVFEDQMRRIIRNQKGFLRFVDTSAKRVACLMLAIIISLTAAVFGVEGLRKPVVGAIQEFFVNVRERLTDTRADNIAVHFTDDIKEIIAVNYITETPKEYLIDNPEKISEFTRLLSEMEWSTPETKYNADIKNIFWTFRFNSNNETVTTLNMCGTGPGNFGKVEIVYNDNSYVYNISEQSYADILSFTTRKYYLHKSKLALPKKEFCERFRNKAFDKLNDSEKEYISETLRTAHIRMEILLLNNVSNLKEIDSLYWYPAITGEEYTDPFGGEKYINGDYSFNGVLKQLEDISGIIKNDECKGKFEIICRDLRSACDNRDIGSLFAVHERIHDYDYFGVNYPPYFELLAPPDWNGINIYFGHLYHGSS